MTYPSIIKDKQLNAPSMDDIAKLYKKSRSIEEYLIQRDIIGGQKRFSWNIEDPFWCYYMYHEHKLLVIIGTLLCSAIIGFFTTYAVLAIFMTVFNHPIIFSLVLTILTFILCAASINFLKFTITEGTHGYKDCITNQESNDSEL